jgi:hypothetical protein
MAKKSFNNITNPALQFMSQPQGDNTAAPDEPEQAAGFKGLKRGRKPSTEETKTKRLNLLMLPSVCSDLAKIAAMKRSSVNELINSILQQYVADNKELLDKYNDVFGSDE